MSGLFRLISGWNKRHLSENKGNMDRPAIPQSFSAVEPLGTFSRHSSSLNNMGVKHLMNSLTYLGGLGHWEDLI